MGGKTAAAIDLAQLERLGRLHCTTAEAAAFFSFSERTLLRRLKSPEARQAWERGRLAGKVSLRRLQWTLANGKGASAVAMTLHLARLWLGEETGAPGRTRAPPARGKKELAAEAARTAGEGSDWGDDLAPDPRALN